MAPSQLPPLLPLLLLLLPCLLPLCAGISLRSTTLAKAATHTEAGCECKDVSTCDTNSLWENKRWCYSQPSSTIALCETQGWDFCKKEVAATPAASTAAVKPIHVLFIGNSLTFFNKLPSMLDRVSGGRIQSTMFAQGGKTLSDHFEDTNQRALNKVIEGGERWGVCVFCVCVCGACESMN